MAVAMVTSNSNNSSGGVSNLRAIFEHKAGDLSTSPPSRGRSPAGSISSCHSRPLSKVRTSFVAIERPGELGGPVQLGLRRASDATMNSLNTNIAAADGASGEPGLGKILKGSPFEEYGPPKFNTKSESAQDTSKNQGAKTNGVAEKAAAVAKKIQEATSKSTNTKHTAPIKVPPAGPTASKVASPTTAKKTPTTPTYTMPKPRGGPAKIQAVMESAKEAREARATAAAGQESNQRKTPVPAAVAPKAPRASLPARLSRPTGSATAPTAASAAKKEPASAVESKPTERKPVSRGPPRVANATTASSLAKKSSRASLGGNELPRPSGAAPKVAADEGFLARMMRPTASSAQKTHDKVQVDSPPRAKPTAGPVKPVTKKTSRRSLATSDKDSGEDKENQPADGQGDNSPISSIPEESEVAVKEQQESGVDAEAEEEKQAPQQVEVKAAAAVTN